MRSIPPRRDGPMAHSSLLHRARAREQRRMTLEIRTLTVSLRGALADLDQDATISSEQRIRLQRAWCERVAVLLQDIRVRSMRIQRLTHHRGTPPAPMQMLDAADADIALLSGPTRRSTGLDRASHVS